MEYNKEITLANDLKIKVDLYHPSCKTAFLLMSHAKLSHDTRFFKE